MEKKKLSTGNEALDAMLTGGYKLGTLTEISGVSDSGKTLLALKAIKECQKAEKVAIYIDTMNALTENMLISNGIDKSMLIVFNLNLADTLGPSLNELKPLINDIGVIILDSLAGLTTCKEQNSSLNTNTDIHRSKVIKALLTRLSNLVRNTDAAVIVINQERSNFIDNQDNGTVSSSERWINMTCDTRIRLSIDDEGDSCVEIKFKERKL